MPATILAPINGICEYCEAEIKTVIEDDVVFCPQCDEELGHGENALTLSPCEDCGVICDDEFGSLCEECDTAERRDLAATEDYHRRSFRAGSYR